jgi:hypothetical protein
MTEYSAIELYLNVPQYTRTLSLSMDIKTTQ